MKRLILISFLLFTGICSAQLSWLKLPNYPGLGLKGMSSFSINGKGYMGLGIDSSGATHTDWYEYDPGNNQWTQKTSFPSQSRFGTVCFVIGSKGYIVGGEYNGSVTNETWEYDATLDSWIQKANAPVARENAAGFVINNKGYYGTGYAGGSSFTSFYEFDPVANSWLMKADFPGIARNGASHFSIGGKGYIGMGNGNQSVTYPLDFYEYDPLTDAWTQKSSFQHTMNSTTNYATSSSGYVLCGYYYQFGNNITHNPMNMLYKYEQSSDAWTLLGTFPGYPRGYAMGFLLSNDLYIGTGGQTNALGDGLNDFWKLANGALLTNVQGTSSSDVDFAISVNPNNNDLTFIVPENMIIQSVRIYNAMGAKISSKVVNGNQISVTELSTGVYFLEAITTDNKVLDGKFVKE